MQMRVRRISSILLMLAPALLAFATASTAQPKPDSGYIPGRFIVRARPDARISLMMQSAAGIGNLQPLTPAPASKPGSERFSQYWVFSTTRADVTATSVASALGQANVERIEQDQYIRLYGFPTDPLFVDQWYLRNTGQQYLGIQRRDGVGNDSLVLKQGTAGIDLRIARYYQTPPTETTKVTVAIVDTGDDLKHPELQGQFWRNPDEIAGNGIDDDHNGYVDDTLGYDVSGDTSSFYNIVGDNDPTDVLGHGTHLAGIVAANAGGAGMVGVAPWAKIMPVKIYPNAFMSIGTQGILYAVNAGAKIINLSWGSPFESFVMKDALDFARANGVFVSIAAGNTGDSTRGYPAAFDSSFTVAAGDSHGCLAAFSTFGSFVTLAAPGVDILSLRAAGTDMYAAGGEPKVRIIGPDSLYYLADGTSMAAPTVAGAAALIWGFRPDLSLGQLEDVLRMGAIDMIDPLQKGDSLVGPDSISGYGYICVECSMDLLLNGGVALTSPVSRGRYGGEVAIKMAEVAGYSGNWTLEYSVGEQSVTWQSLAQGNSLPADSTIARFNHPEINNVVNLRLTDRFGTSKVTSFRYVNSNQLALGGPLTGDTLRFSVPVSASAYGPTFDSVTLGYRSPAGRLVHLFSSTEEFFDTLLYTWNVSGASAGNYDIVVRGYFGQTVRSDSSHIYMSSAFAAGWPQTLPGRGGQTVVAADLNHDGVKEVILGTFYGLYVYEANGQLLPHFPVLPTKDMRCVPAIYDVDGDGWDEIVSTNADGLHAIKYDGTEAAGFPHACTTGRLVFGYPTPTIASLAPGQPKVISFIDTFGNLQAFKMNGAPYFYSLGGLFAKFNPYATSAYFFAGNELSVADILGTGRPQVVATYCGLTPRTGVALFDGRNGQPALDQSIPQILTNQLVYGTALGDLTGDSLPEIVVTGQDSAYTRTVWLLTRTPDGTGITNMPGWPIVCPELNGWIGNIPTIADLDNDGIPEILFAFYDFDIGSLYAFRIDGTPYRSFPGRPVGELFNYPTTFGVPMVADLTGDSYPEIIFRGGYILPGAGTEKLFVLDHNGQLLPGYPVPTPALKNEVVSNPFAPMVDDIDGDGKVDLVFSGDGEQIYVWNSDASSRNGKNRTRLGGDNLNSHIYHSPGIPTGVNDGPAAVPHSFSLGQNYPNPFNPTTTIAFEVPSRGLVRLEVYNVLGQQVRTLVDEEMAAGEHRVEFNAVGLASGLYLYRISVGNQVAVKKMVLLK
jgi:subtilisin family serine protease